MDHKNFPRLPSQDLISLATPSQEFNEKAPHFQPPSQSPSPFVPPSRPSHPHKHHGSRSPSSSPRSGAPAPHNPGRTFVRPPQIQLPSRNFNTPPHTRPPTCLRVSRLLKPWTPVILYAITSIAFLVAIALYRTELFARESTEATHLSS
jgi:hypothetical protein